MKKIIVLFIGLLVFACNSEHKLDKEKYLNEGKEIAQSTAKTLSGHVKKAIKEKGPIEAINFCRLSAYPLTDSLSKLYDVKISRVALKNRNPENKAIGMDLEIIKRYEELIFKGEKVKPEIKKDKDKIVFYAPIRLQQACLICHGKPQSEIPDTLFKHIQTLYPDDLAVNFKEGDLRGVWKLEFENKE
ncbi:MAG: DUF3365 domain-containing protein [Bacteroidales bacterium]|nr:DUF3365 domain-containing protein [Bacteroidales bacterium]